MPPDRVVGERPDDRLVLQRGRVLERPDPQVTRGHAGQDRAPLDPVPVDRFAGGDDREAAGGGDAEGGQGLADHVLAEHRTQRGQPVPAAGEPGPPRPLELDVHQPAVRSPVLAEQDGPAVAEHGEVAELVPGVRLGDRPRTRRRLLAGEHCREGVRRERPQVEAEFAGQPVVQDCHPRLTHPGRRGGGVEGGRQPRVSILEPPAGGTRPRNHHIRTDHFIPE